MCLLLSVSERESAGERDGPENATQPSTCAHSPQACLDVYGSDLTHQPQLHHCQSLTLIFLWREKFNSLLQLMQIKSESVSQSGGLECAFLQEQTQLRWTSRVAQWQITAYRIPGPENKRRTVMRAYYQQQMSSLVVVGGQAWGLGGERANGEEKRYSQLLRVFTSAESGPSPRNNQAKNETQGTTVTVQKCVPERQRQPH